MILDSTYLLPLVGIEINTNLLEAVLNGKIGISLGSLNVSLISLFEVQAKAVKLKVPWPAIRDGIITILDSFGIIPFYLEDIIRISWELREIIGGLY